MIPIAADGSILTGSALEETVRALCSDSERVVGALTRVGRVTGWLAALSGARARRVHLLTMPPEEKPTPGPGRPPPSFTGGAMELDRPERRWRLHYLRAVPAPEFLLFYGRAPFPTAAVILLGSDDPPAWAAVYRRPIALDLLQRRFEALLARAIQVPAAGPQETEPRRLAAPAVRERPDASPESPEAGPELREAELLDPPELYRRILRVHFRAVPSDSAPRPGGASELTPHQERAYERARAILDRYGGVVIADSVGLGKTYVGLRLIEDAVRADRRVRIIVPAALRRDWRSHLAYLGAAVRSEAAARGRQPGSGSGPARSTPNLELWLQETAVPGASVLSMESLGRRSFEIGSHRGAELVLVDEAHHFRNPRTRRYRNLLHLTRDARVVLLTATPVNNSLLDLRHLIELFAAPGAFRHLGVPDFRLAFGPDEPDRSAIDAIISACVIRRTRRFLRERYGTIRVHDPATGAERSLRFPDREPPVAVRYRLSAIYGRTMAPDRLIERLHLPSLPPEPESDGDPEAGLPSAELLKIVLLKRLESSVEAFRASVIQQLAWSDTALRAARTGRAVTRPEYRRLFRGPADDPAGQLAFVELMMPESDRHRERLREFGRRLEEDIGTFTELHRRLKRIGPAEDRKLRRLVRLLDGALASRKAIIFTEFRDTARYLHRALAARPHLGLIHSGESRLGRQPAARRDVIERFAPRSNGRPEPPSRERVNLLIATDVVSEGLNLQDASVVVSYDLPWNPVRLMQRMGRIDRLGSCAGQVRLYHFVPDRDLDRLLGLMDRLRSKVRTISATLGLDAPVLALDAPVPAPDGPGSTRDTIERLGRGVGGWAELEARIEGPLDPEEQAYLDLTGANATAPPSPSDVRRPEARPPGDRPTEDEAFAGRPAIAVTRLSHAAGAAVSYWSIEIGGRRSALWLILVPPDGTIENDPARAVELLRAARRSADAAEHAPRIERLRRAFHDHASEFGRRLAASHLAGDALSPGLPQVRLAAWLARELESGADRLPLELRTRIDVLLQALGHRHSAAAERALARILSRRPAPPDPETLSAIERIVGEPERGDATAPRIREIGTMLILPDPDAPLDLESDGSHHPPPDASPFPIGRAGR